MNDIGGILNLRDRVDDDLRLSFVEKGITTPPDENLPVYKFRMVNRITEVEMGGINLRAGYTENVINYRGNIGFTVYEPYQGHNYSARSCILLKPVIKSLGLNPVWLTCDVTNLASKRNIELIGARYIDTVTVEESSPFSPYYPDGSRTKLRFRWAIE